MDHAICHDYLNFGRWSSDAYYLALGPLRLWASWVVNFVSTQSDETPKDVSY